MFKFAGSVACQTGTPVGWQCQNNLPAGFKQKIDHTWVRKTKLNYIIPVLIKYAFAHVAQVGQTGMEWRKISQFDFPFGNSHNPTMLSFPKKIIINYFSIHLLKKEFIQRNIVLFTICVNVNFYMTICFKIRKKLTQCRKLLG